jgi:hypothetical protein
LSLKTFGINKKIKKEILKIEVTIETASSSNKEGIQKIIGQIGINSWCWWKIKIKLITNTDILNI